MNELALFAGAGGGILGGHLLGWRTVCAVERDAYAAQVLAARQNDRTLRPFPIWSDVCSFDGRPWRGIVDVVSGGFPCQDISAAGRGAGLAGARSGLWSQMARIVAEVRPRVVYVENSPILTSRGLGTVLGDLAALGFDAEWGVVSAADTGAQHLRERIWIVAHAERTERRPQRCPCHGLAREDCVSQRPEGAGRSGSSGADVADPHRERHRSEIKAVCTRRHASQPGREPVSDTYDHEINRRCGPLQMGRRWRSEEDGHHGHALGNEWPPEPDVGRVANGVAHRVDRLNGLGNGQVPRVAAAAFHLLSSRI
ncbi:DNA cytosine methyltransferase [Achromobacter denitrificans]|uniref:DNA cytosine methyltransferase n=1 Tax=Achromobacter denitrificans TaxID=32002 RepID=UPI000B49318D